MAMIRMLVHTINSQAQHDEGAQCLDGTEEQQHFVRHLEVLLSGTLKYFDLHFERISNRQIL